MISLSQSQGNSSLVWEGIYWIDADGLFCSSAWPLCESEQPWSVGKWERREQEAFQLPVSESSGSSYSAEWRKVEWLQCSCCEKSRGKPVRVSSAVSTYTLPPPSLLWLVSPPVLSDLPPAASKDAEQGKCGDWPVWPQPQGPWPLLKVWSLCGHLQVIISSPYEFSEISKASTLHTMN